jgi:hypothetical protein
LQGGLILVLWLTAHAARGKLALATFGMRADLCTVASSIADEPQLTYQVIATASYK